MSLEPIQNILLIALSSEDRALLEPFEPISLAIRTPLESPGGKSDFVYFVESGIASVVAGINGQREVEVGIAGRDGMVGVGLIYGDPVSTFESYMQVEGSALRLDAARFSVALGRSATLRQVLLRYARVFSIQVAATAVANGQAKLEERLARWLLMVSDRTGPQFQITHEFISIMLAVRRPGVTVALQNLEGRGLIKAVRASISVVDREGLILASAGAYGVPEREYERLLGAAA